MAAEYFEDIHRVDKQRGKLGTDGKLPAASSTQAKPTKGPIESYADARRQCIV